MSELGNKVRDRIDHLRTLEQNWDSYGAEPLTEELLDFVQQHAEAFAALLGGATGCGIFPTSEGEIQFEFEVGGRMLEITVSDFGVEP